jgi:hypothetical protein
VAGDFGPTVPGTSAENERRRIYTASSQSERLRQGEVLSELLQARLALGSLSATGSDQALSETTPVVRVEYDEHPLVVVLGQDCDLEQDYSRRSAGGRPLLLNVLLADVFDAGALQGRLRTEENSGSSDWRRIKGNHVPRFQFLHSVAIDQDSGGTGLPDLAVDFRLYFSMRTDELYERLKLGLTKKRCRLQTPYAEHLAHRFYTYQSRVPLAREHGV